MNICPDNFIDIFPFTDGPARSELDGLLKQLESFPGTFCCAIKLDCNDYAYISKSVQEILGHPYEFFLSQGLAGFFSITVKEWLPGILAAQAGYLKDSQSPNFDPDKPIIANLQGAVYRADGTEVSINVSSVFVDYTESGEPNFAISSYQLAVGESPEERSLVKGSIENILVQVKATYRAMRPKKSLPKEKVVRAILKNYNPAQPIISVTRREEEILGLLARGMSTKEIADKLAISINTAETHRRHLLEKFEAKNSAELIMKASKVYWFE